jgi:hypothetical protein
MQTTSLQSQWIWSCQQGVVHHYTCHLCVKWIKPIGKIQRYNDDNTAITIQQSCRDDANGILLQTNKVKQQHDQSFSKSFLNATALYNTVCVVLSGLDYCEIYFKIKNDS